MRTRAIKILHEMQKWRRGGGQGMPFSPVVFGVAIDVAIRVLRRVSNEQFNEILYGNDVRKIRQALSEAVPREHDEVEGEPKAQ